LDHSYRETRARSKGSALMFTVSQLPPDQKYVIIGLITIGFAFHEVAWMGGFSFAFMDMAPDYVGIIQGINNTIGLMPGFIIPVVISNLTPEVFVFIYLIIICFMVLL
jgi:hypothetical protein